MKSLDIVEVMRLLRCMLTAAPEPSSYAESVAPEVRQLCQLAQGRPSLQLQLRAELTSPDGVLHAFQACPSLGVQILLQVSEAVGGYVHAEHSRTLHVKERRTVCMVLMHEAPIRILDLIRRKLLRPELNKVATGLRAAGRKCASIQAYNSAGKTVHDQLIAFGVSREELLEVLEGLHLNEPTGNPALIKKWTQYIIWSYYLHRDGHKYLGGTQADIKSGDSDCVPHFGPSFKCKSPCHQRYNTKFYDQLVKDRCSEAHWVCNGSSVSRAVLEIGFNWTARDVAAAYKYLPSVKTGEEGLLGPSACAEEAFCAVLEEVRNTPVFQKMFTDDRSQRTGGGAWQHGSTLQYAPFCSDDLFV